MSVRLGYLISRYPAISHTFILREVLELRRLGFDIGVASINGPDRPIGGLTRDEKLEAGSTYYVKAAGIGGALRANLATVLGRPAAYVRGLSFAILLGGTDIRRVILCMFYFVEAVLVGCWMEAGKRCHLHVHFGTPAATVGLIVSKIFPITFSMTIHGPDEFYDVPGTLLMKKIEAASLICTIGLYARSQVMMLCPAPQWPKIKVAPLGVDPELFLPQTAQPGRKGFEVLCVGRLVAAKGQRVLVAAVHELLLRGRHVRLRLVGDGPDRRSLEEAVRSFGMEDQVIFSGSVNQDEIRDLFARADVFAMASFAEGIPVVLMEAMAMEIPCISTWITGIPELIRNRIDGLLVAPSDEMALADAIALLMDNEDLRRSLGSAGRKRVIDRYNLRTNVATLAAVFDEHLARSPLAAVA